MADATAKITPRRSFKVSEPSETRHAFLVFLGAVIISFSGVFVKASDIGPTAAGFYRVFFGGLFLLIIILIQRKSIFKSRLDLLLGASAGIFFAGDLFSWHIAIKYIGPGLATIIANFQVFFMAVLGWMIFRESITPRIAAAVPLAVAGLFLMVGVNWNNLGPQYHMGVMWSFIAAVAYSGFMVFLKKLQRRPYPISAESALFIVCVVTSSILGSYCIHTGESLVLPDIKNTAYMVALGVICHAGGWMIITRGLPHTRSSLAGLLLLVQPALSFVWDILFFSRPTTKTDIVGAVVALIAIYMGAAGKRK